MRGFRVDGGASVTSTFNKSSAEETAEAYEPEEPPDFIEILSLALLDLKGTGNDEH